MEKDCLHRISTFAKCTEADNISLPALARKGFHYREDTNTARCSSCNVDIHPDNGSLIEDILKKHKLLSPHCNFVSANTEEDIQQSATLSGFNDTTADYSQFCKINPGFGHDPTSAATTSKNPINSTSRLQLDFDELCLEAVRLSTFRDWPLKAKARPQVLARNGFFYGGSGERVQCAFCNGCIGNWEAPDEPSAKHKSLFPDCPFVRGFDVGNISLGVRDNSPDRGYTWNTIPASSRSPLEISNLQSTSLSQSAQSLVNICLDHDH